MNSNGLTHDEVWDDTALVDSWNKAVKEYKVLSPSSQTPQKLTRRQKYHSIHAKGGSVDDIEMEMPKSVLHSLTRVILTYDA